MNEPQAIEAEVIPPQSQAVAVREHVAPPAPGLFGTDQPVQVIQRATDVATALKAVISKQGLISKISGREYPKCEAWTLLGTMLGVFPVLIWTRRVEGGWEARVEAKTKDGATVGAAEAECLKTERNWKDRDDFALRSMAQTRATAKCLRMPLGFVMTLAGYEPTPAEEMVADHPQNARRGAASPPPPSTPTQAPKTAPTPKPATAPPANAPHPTPPATAETRARMLDQLQAGPGQDNRRLVHEYFVKVGQILENETPEDLPLRWVPTTKKQFNALVGAVANFECGGDAVAAFDAPNPEAPPVAKPKPGKPVEVPRDPPGPPPAPTECAEWFMSIVVPVPHKGQKRDDYLKHPDTIGSLFEMRHGNDEEAQAARQRLWGFVSGYEPKGWTKTNGTQMPPSAADLKFRDALDAFAEWFEREHPGEKL